MTQPANPTHSLTTLDIATYIGIAAMSLLGISGLPTLNMQLLALAFCLLFGLLYWLYFQTDRYLQNPHLYFGAQGVVLGLVFILGSNTTDAFNFLFLLLVIHVALALPGRTASRWIAVYYLFVSGVVLATRGLEGVYAAVFYLIIYIVCGYFGSTLQSVEKARDHNQKLVVELQAAQRRVQELAVVEERNRLARDLHDSVKQQVFAISMQLGAARAVLQETDRALAPVLEAERLANRAGAELTTLIRELRPPELEHQSLATALEQYLADWSRQNGIETALHIPAPVSASPAVEQTLFRVAQEALANVARHSRADKVTVTWTMENGAVVLVIEDNGIGFERGEVAPGVGLNSMRERLAAVGGQLDVASQKHVGTRITAKCGITASTRSI